MTDLISPAKIAWRCRRGMLELDAMLKPFFTECFAALSASEQQAFAELLEAEDPDLHAWLSGHSVAPTSELQHIVQLVQQHAQR